MTKKIILGTLMQEDKAIGYVQYKNDKEVEVWFEKKYFPAGCLELKSAKKFIGNSEVDAKKLTCNISDLNKIMKGLNFSESSVESEAHRKVIKAVKASEGTNVTDDAGYSSTSNASTAVPSPIMFSRTASSDSLGSKYPIYDSDAKYREHEIVINEKSVTVGASANPEEFACSNRSLFDQILNDYKILISLSPIDMGSELKKLEKRDTIHYKDTAPASDLTAVNMYIHDFSAISSEQLDQLEKILVNASENDYSIMLHCGSGCGRTGHVLIAMMLIEKIRNMSLDELEKHDLTTSVPVAVESDKNEKSLGTPLIRELEQKVTEKMGRDQDRIWKMKGGIREKQDNPIENKKQLQALIDFEKSFVAKSLQAKQRNVPR